MSDAIDDLEAEPDARRAVIAAYARMEGVLARHGLRRKPSETPLEYLRRILLGLTARADAVRRLTSLFEQAKFSRHDDRRVDEAGRDRRAARDPRRPARAHGVRRHLLDLIVLFVFISVIAGYVALAQPCASQRDAARVRVPRRRPADARHRRRGRRPRARTGTAPSSTAALGAAERREKQLPEIEKLQREVTLATASAYDLHYRLLPHLREIAQMRPRAQRQDTRARRRSGAGGTCFAPTGRRPRTASRKGISETDLRALVADLARM